MMPDPREAAIEAAANAMAQLDHQGWMPSHMDLARAAIEAYERAMGSPEPVTPTPGPR